MLDTVIRHWHGNFLAHQIDDFFISDTILLTEMMHVSASMLVYCIQLFFWFRGSTCSKTGTSSTTNKYYEKGCSEPDTGVEGKAIYTRFSTKSVIDGSCCHRTFIYIFFSFFILRIPVVLAMRCSIDTLAITIDSSYISLNTPIGIDRFRKLQQ